MTTMQYRNLGSSGLQVSIVGIGCNNFGNRVDQAETARIVHAALDCGINLFDTADVYASGRSEEFLGAAVRDRRDEVIIATKFRGKMGPGPHDQGGSRRYLVKALDASLHRLGTDYIDLYQMHSPDPATPIEETLSTLNDLVHQGKVRYIGCSNFDGWQIADAAWTARTNHWEPFISAQNHYSLVNREVEREVIPACKRFGLGMLPYFPLASGVLTGKYRRGRDAPEGTRLAGNPQAYGRFATDHALDVVERLEAFGEERNISLVQIAIGALAAQPQVSSVIAGVTKIEQVETNARAAEWSPSAADLKEIDDLAPSQRRM